MAKKGFNVFLSDLRSHDPILFDPVTNPFSYFEFNQSCAAAVALIRHNGSGQEEDDHLSVSTTFSCVRASKHTGD